VSGVSGVGPKLQSTQWPADDPFGRLTRKVAWSSARNEVDICHPPVSTSLLLATSAAPNKETGASRTGAGSSSSNSSSTGVTGRPPTGHVDVANASLVAGWASDPDDPTAAVVVEISVDGTVWRRVAASSARADVGPHAFGWEVSGLHD
jgi:hypothetical protein